MLQFLEIRSLLAANHPTTHQSADQLIAIAAINSTSSRLISVRLPTSNGVEGDKFRRLV